MNIVNKLPQEIYPLVRKYTIGYRTTIIDDDGYRLEIWIGPQEYRTGNYKSWYPNDELYTDENYLYGKLHGPCKTWYEDGCNFY